VDNLRDLREKLWQFVSGETEIAGCYRGLVKRARADSSLEAEAEDVGTAARERLAVLARRWANGASVDWAALHAGRRPRKISLPTYPFARERHWIAAAEPSASDIERQERDDNGRNGLGELLEDVLSHKLDLQQAARQARALLNREHTHGLS